MSDFTLNTDILVAASAPEDAGPKLIATCRDLLEAMQETDDVQLVLDTNRKIEQEYQDKVSNQSLGEHFVRRMSEQEGKVHWVCRAKGNSWKRVRLPLVEAGKGQTLHQADQIFVRAAMVSDDKRIVAEEEHFHRASVKRVLKNKAKVVVLHASEAKGKI